MPKKSGSEARNGTVTLAGLVDTYSQKLRAEHAAQRVAGVKSLAVHIDVRCISADAASERDCSGFQGMPPWTTFYIGPGYCKCCAVAALVWQRNSSPLLTLELGQATV